MRDLGISSVQRASMRTIFHTAPLVAELGFYSARPRRPTEFTHIFQYSAFVAITKSGRFFAGLKDDLHGTQVLLAQRATPHRTADLGAAQHSAQPHRTFPTCVSDRLAQTSLMAGASGVEVKHLSAGSHDQTVCPQMVNIPLLMSGTRALYPRRRSAVKPL